MLQACSAEWPLLMPDALPGMGCTNLAGQLSQENVANITIQSVLGQVAILP
jgi:hypothetical protein